MDVYIHRLIRLAQETREAWKTKMTYVATIVFYTHA